ncbi:protease HtpX [uncultured Aquimonas sp.]|jgi:heat shock protein HtpX|uniref:protease HtpX n=1 Tax=uncultured Aquimonas sp. TaxID=385483 RepID=UPI00086CDD35|nr:protease HtpX [uncultured Aquimonas sp.]ODU44969.1 MAG: zinc metalloprotease HtpX [Xanthomonadaceae bacterium SCN 69-123]
MKRIALFLATNIAVLLVASIVLNLLGVDAYMASRGQNLGGLIVFAAVFGFAGSFISLAMSKWVAKRGTGAQVIEQPRNEMEAWLLQTVQRQAQMAGIKCPEVAIYDAPEINAFATGPSRNNSLVAVSTGLLRGMSRDEAEAVLGHEVAHVANGDMVTMALLQGVLNTFVIVLSRLIGSFVDRVILRNEEGGGIGFFVVSLIAQVVLGILASMIAMAFSRHREFRADEGGAKLAGRQKMIAALERLQAQHGENTLPREVAAFGISGHMAAGLQRLFMSHPPLPERIEALRRAA